ncbi:hypothetical protein OUZ56_011863 [Daphnia magna]|uniref:Uncharacterized protein n=1 Tax=Daphnia magna TaxID=35525 RepID=A0ABQ9Z1D9_9CRUS|nr:hypothetical protein OUZ56_011863 [Daphnia magna]
MEKTFEFRDRESTFRFTSASEILLEYPRFIDVEEGSLILLDFHRKYPDTHYSLQMRFLKRFSTSLTLLAERQKINVPNSADDCLKSLALCLKLMPSVHKIKKASFESKLDRMFHFVKQNASIAEAVKGKDAVHHKQPYLIVL